jgi:hypothetical protein
MAHAQCVGSIFRNARQLRLRFVFTVPSSFSFCARSITRPLISLSLEEAEELAHTAELACGRSEAEEKEQEQEKEKRRHERRAVCMGAFTSLRMTRTTFLGVYLRTQYSSAYGRPITYLLDGSRVEVHSPSHFCLSHACILFSCVTSCGAPWCNQAHRGGMGPGG